MSRAPSSGHVASLLHCVLDSVVSPSAKTAMLHAALAEHRLSAIPSEPEEFRRFVQGPLRNALSRGLGDALAAVVLAELEIAEGSKPPTLRPGALPPSGVVRDARSVSTLPPPRLPRAPAISTNPLDAFVPPALAVTAPPVSGPVRQQPRPGVLVSAEFPALDKACAAHGLVLALTKDRRTAGSLEAWLGCRTRVVVVPDAVSLVHEIAASPSSVLVVIDCNAPSVRPIGVAALAADLPVQARFVLWGATPEDENALAAVNPASRDWARCAGVDAADLAAYCAALVS